MTMTEPAPPPTAEAEPEAPVAVEVLEATERPERSAADSALERAAEAALALPGIPGREEFLSLAMQARILAMSGAAPPLVRGNPHLAFHIAMVGRDLGISPSAALELIDVIDGKKGPQLSLSPELMNGQIARLGLGSIVPVVRTRERAVAVALETGGRVDYRCKRVWPEHVEGCSCRGILDETEFTWEDAQDAGLAGSECRPGAHKVVSKPGKNGGTYKSCGCNTGYQNYPRRMMWWRAAGFCADDNFPAAGLGLYSPEELGAVVDAEGRPIDPADVELPEGYAPKVLPPEPKADAGVVDDLKDQIKALWPNVAARAVFVELWNRSDGTQPLPHVEQLLARQVTRAKAVVKTVEDRMAKGEFGQEPAEAAQEPREGDASAETAEDTGKADQPAPGAPEPAQEASEEDRRAEELAKAANEEAWGKPLGEVRARLRELGREEQGEPEDVRRRLETELLRRSLLVEAQTSTSLMDAYAEDDTPSG